MTLACSRDKLLSCVRSCELFLPPKTEAWEVTKQLLSANSMVLEGGGLEWRGMEEQESILSSTEELCWNWEAHVVDEKSIPDFKINIL